jgi:hypothetical protein
MLEVGSHTVLVFVKLQFLGQWTRWSGIQFIGYTSGKAAQLLVVTDFKLDPAQDVWVEEDVVHIPAICLKSAPGDQARCRG